MTHSDAHLRNFRKDVIEISERYGLNSSEIVNELCSILAVCIFSTNEKEQKMEYDELCKSMQYHLRKLCC